MIKLILKFFVSDVLAKTMALVLLPFYSLLMGPEELGRFSEWFSIYSVLVAIITLGIPNYVLVLLNSENEADVSNLSGKFLNFFIMWFIITAFFTLFFFTVTKSLVYGFSLIIAAVSFGVLNYVESILRFKKQVKVYFILEFLLTLSTSLIPLFFILLNASWGYRVIGYVFGLSSLVIVLKLLYIPSIPLIKTDRAFKKEIVKFGIPIVLAVGINWMKLGIDIQLLKNIDNYKTSGILFFSFQIISVINILAASLNRSAAPTLYNLISEGKLYQFFTLILKLLSLLILFAAILIFVFVGGIEIYLPRFSRSIEFLYIMSIGTIIYALGQFIASIFLFYRKTYFLTLAMFVSSLSHPLASYYIINHTGASYIGYSYLFSGVAFLLLVLIFTSLYLFLNNSYFYNFPMKLTKE